MSMAVAARGGSAGWVLPPWRRLLAGLAGMGVVLFASATIGHLEIPEPSGAYGVGRERLTWVDQSRPEAHTPDPTDRRAVPVQVWYPAVPDTGTSGPYVPGLEALSSSLVGGGELSAAQTWALQWVRHHARDQAQVATSDSAYPIVLLSPGNLTNVAFYAHLAEELASRGYVVVGVDHPYQVAAVELPGGSVAQYDASWDSSAKGAEGGVPAKVEERVADVLFVLSRLASEPSAVQEHLDFDRVAAIGHSNGGLTAMETCRRSAEIHACVNLDGQAAGGPLSVDVDGTAPHQPFMFLTKETFLHPEMNQRFEAAGHGAHRVVVPDASHDDFADGALFQPGLNPAIRTEDRVAEVVRGFVVAFLDQELKDAPPEVLGAVPATTDVYVNVYPLGANPPIPATS